MSLSQEIEKISSNIKIDSTYHQCLAGLKYIGHGMKLSLHPQLRYYVLIPILINAIIFSGATYFTFEWINTHLLDWLTAWNPTDLPEWLNWLKPIIGFLISLIEIIFWFTFIFGILFIFVSVFTALVHTIAAPFNAFLSEKVEKSRRNISYPEFSISQVVVRSIKRELERCFYWIPRALGLGIISFICTWIPLLNLIPPLLWGLFAAWMLSLQYLDYASDNNGYSIKDTINKMKKYRFTLLVFGGATTLLTLIPVLNWFVMTGAVIGGTLLWINLLDIDHESHTSANL